MLNQLVLVGRLVRNPELRESENGKKYAFITLAVPRSFKNADGVYDTDFIDCVLWDNAASNTVEYCKKGDIVGVRGRIQVRQIENEETEEKQSKTEVICERVTFLSNKKPEELENDGNIDDLDKIEAEL